MQVFVTASATLRAQVARTFRKMQRVIIIDDTEFALIEEAAIQPIHSFKELKVDSKAKAKAAPKLDDTQDEYTMHPNLDSRGY